jgi:hypothetical protein
MPTRSWVQFQALRKDKGKKRRRRKRRNFRKFLPGFTSNHQ